MSKKVEALLKNRRDYTSKKLSRRLHFNKRETLMSDTEYCSRCRFDVDDNRRHNAAINIQNQSIRCQFRRFRKKCITKEIPTETWAKDKNTDSSQLPNSIHQHKEEKEKCIQFPLFTSEHHLSTRSKTFVNLKKFKFFVVFMCPKHVYTIRRNTHGQVQYWAALKSFKEQQLR